MADAEKPQDAGTAPDRPAASTAKPGSPDIAPATPTKVELTLVPNGTTPHSSENHHDAVVDASGPDSAAAKHIGSQSAPPGSPAPPADSSAAASISQHSSTDSTAAAVPPSPSPTASSSAPASPGSPPPPSSNGSSTVTSPSSPTPGGEEDDTDGGRPPQRKHFGDDIWAPKWTQRRKHIFILTNTGRPIYSRYGDESKLSHIMGILSTFVAVVEGGDHDVIRYVVAGDLKVVFTLIGPFILVAVAHGEQPASTLHRQLVFLHAQILSILTGGVQKVLESRPNFDLRNLLGGAERFFDSLTHLADRDLSFNMSAMHFLRADPYLRGMLAKSLTAAPHPDLTFALLISGFQVIHYACPSAHPLQPSDLQLIMNTVSGSPSFKHTSSWTPICLPAFNSRGFMHAFISYILPTAALVLLSPRQEAFHEMQKCKKAIVSHMKTNGLLELLRARTMRPLYSVSETGVRGLLHFVYKDRRVNQFTTCALAPPYTNVEEGKRLGRLYQSLSWRVHASASGSHKVFYRCSQSETVLGWQTFGFELYAAFGPLETKLVCIRGCNALLNWLKREEASLFVLTPSLW